MIKRLLFYNFRFIFIVDRWIRRHFTKAGLLILVGLIAASIFGVDIRQTNAYQLVALFAVLLLLATLTSYFFYLHLTVKRMLPRFATVGENLTYQIKIHNHSKKLEKNLLILEDIKPKLPSFQTFLQAKEPNQSNWFDNYVGYPRWVWLTHISKGIATTITPLPHLMPHAITEVAITLIPLRRGHVHFTRMTFARPDPFGLFYSLYHIDLSNNLLVLPKRYPLPAIHLSGSRKYQRGGVQLAMSVGDAQEFVSLREYRPGDPFKHIHWKSWAKIGKPVVKEFQDEFFVRHALILDTFTQSAGQLFEAAVSVAASFVSAPRSQEVLLNLMLVGSQAYCFTSGRGITPTDNLLEILACIEACTDKSFTCLYSLVTEHATALSGVIVILLDWNEERRELIRLLKNNAIPMLVILVTTQSIDIETTFAHEIKIVHLDSLEQDLMNL